MYKKTIKKIILITDYISNQQNKNKSLRWNKLKENLRKETNKENNVNVVVNK